MMLETSRLRFRQHLPADLDPFCAMEADPGVRKFVGGNPRSRAEAEQKFESTYLRPIQHRMGLWATELKPNGPYVGYCGVYSHLGTNGPIPGEGTLAFYLAQAYWGQGFATEAGTMFVRFAFQELLLRRLVATVQTGNSASLRVLEKLGFSWHHFEPGEARSFNHFELLAT